MENKNKSRNLFSAREISRVALFTSLIAVCAWICIPTAIPFTLQTFAVFLSIAVLGEKKALFAILAYLLLGVMGVPVFSSFRGGIGAILSLDGGYIIGFLLIPLSSAIFCAVAKNRKWARGVGISVGLILCYLLGSAWFVIATGKSGFWVALSTCVLPFILPDFLKLTLALFIAKRVDKRR